MIVIDVGWISSLNSTLQSFVDVGFHFVQPKLACSACANTIISPKQFNQLILQPQCKLIQKQNLWV